MWNINTEVRENVPLQSSQSSVQPCPTIEGAERNLEVLKGAFECFSSPSMLMFSISYRRSVLWHGRGRRFDPDQVHQLYQ